MAKSVGLLKESQSIKIFERGKKFYWAPERNAENYSPLVQGMTLDTIYFMSWPILRLKVVSVPGFEISKREEETET